MTPAPVIRLHPDDGVLIARSSLPPGMVVADGVSTIERIPAGHKVAIKPIALGEPIRRYGQIIGFATVPISPGQHVHTQNCGMGDFAKDYAFGVDVIADPELRSACDLRRHSPSRWPGRDPQLYRHPDLGELQRACRRHGRRRLQEKSVYRRQSAGRFSQCRRRGRAHPQDRLRHDPGRAADVASAHAGRLRAACEFLRRGGARARLRGQPDRGPDAGAEARRAPARTGNPANRRHPQDGGGRRRLCARGAGRRQQGEA